LDYIILRSIFDDKKAIAYDRIMFGFMSIIFAIGLPFMFIFSGVLF